jgi:aminodeoxychorismate lyase
MVVFLNGKFVPEHEALVSVFDRSFLYGDGLFETMLVANGAPFRWAQHFQRLQRGADFLQINLRFGAPELLEFASQLVSRNKMSDALLRLTLSRGVGVRGYSPGGADQPTVVMSLHPAPQLLPEPHLWHLTTSSFRLPANEPLAQLKHCNKLPQILARAQADKAGTHEALLVNTEGFIVEGASSNLFWVERGMLHTPPLASGILSGVTRLVVLELSASVGIQVREENITPKNLAKADGVFLSLSSFGIVEADRLDGIELRRSSLVKRLHSSYIETVLRETK